MDGWSLTQYMNRKLQLAQSMQVSLWLSNIAFHLQPIWLQTSNRLVPIDWASCHRSFPSFCMLPSEVAVLFNR